MKGVMARLLLAGAALFGWRCSGNLGGGSSEAEGFTLSGRIVDSSQQPLPGARVALFDAGDLGRADNPAAPLDSARTNGEGRWTLEGIRQGRYTLLATAEGAARAALRSGIDLVDHDTLEALSVRGAGALSGKVPAGFPYTQAVRMALLETPYRAAIAGDGSFSLTGIVPGTYVLAMVLRSNFAAADPAVLGTWDTVTVAAGQHLVFDSLAVPSLGASAPVLVDDFSDCDRFNGLGGEWWSTDDRGAGGSSRVDELAFADPGDGTGGCAARFAFTFGPDAPFPFVGAGTYFQPETASVPRAVSLENAAGFSFRVKGRGARLEVLVQSSASGLVSGQGFEIDTLPEAWTTYTVDFRTGMRNTFDSTDIRSWQLRRKAATHLQFDALPVAGIDSGEVWIDDVRLLPP